MTQKLFRRIILIAAIILVLWVTYIWWHESTPARMVDVPHEATSSSQILPQAVGEMTNVTYIIDGDTIEVAGGRRVRYIGVNAPEIAHPGTKEECFGVIATDENKSLVSGKTVRLVSDVVDKDVYGRLLRMSTSETSL